MWFLKIWCLARVGKSTFITPARTHIHTHAVLLVQKLTGPMSRYGVS